MPEAWTAVFDLIHRDAGELEGYLEDAGLESLEAWEERRVRRVDPKAYLARILAVASHLHEGIDPERLAFEQDRVARAVHAAAGARGFEYSFVKLFGVARRPGGARPPLGPGRARRRSAGAGPRIDVHRWRAAKDAPAGGR